MGIVNVTPDSFTDGGLYMDPARAVAHALTLIDAGAAIIDVGGESTRPGAKPVAPEDEIARIVPVVAQLASRGATVSIDTRHAPVMRAALAAGASIINDVSALTHDADSLSAAAESDAAIVLMHMLGDPGSMNDAPVYNDLVPDILHFLRGRIEACVDAGVDRTRIAVDPGIGFGKTPAHNRELLARLGEFRALGCPVMVGASRKFARADAPASVRLATSVAASLRAAEAGAAILRVHDVAETAAALALWAKSR